MAYDGGCVQPCNTMGYFLTVIFILIVCTFFNNIPAITVTLRWVLTRRVHFIFIRITDLINKTGLSIYCWETEANGDHIGVTT